MPAINPVNQWTDSANAAVEPLLKKIKDMPFIQALIDGSLDISKFRFYIAQDAIYLQHFARALSIIAARVPSVYMLDFMKFAQGALQVEEAMHADYLKEYGVIAPVPISPSCHHYVSFLKSSVSLGTVGEALASILPCFRIYKDVGDYILSMSSITGHPYSRWINTYSGDEFGLLVARVLDIANAVACIASSEELEVMTETYIRATQLEWMFWDSAWRQESWL